MCIDLWKTGDTISGNWTDCCDDTKYRFMFEWVKSPTPGTKCPPKIRKQKCWKRQRKECSSCVYGEWGEWGECSVQCGGGHMSRYRDVSQGLDVH